MAIWRRYAHFIIGMAKYVGTSQAGTNRAQQIRMDVIKWADVGEHDVIFMAGQTDVPFKDAFPT